MQRATVTHLAVLMLLLLAGCQPVECEETYSPLVKLLVGAPLPMLITVALAVPLIAAIGAALGHPARRRVGAWSMVALSCVLPWPATQIIGPGLGLIVLGVALLGVAALSLWSRDDDPDRQSWTHALSGALKPSIGSRVFGGVLVVVLVLLTLVGSAATTAAVVFAGQECHPIDLPRAPASAAVPVND